MRCGFLGGGRVNERGASKFGFAADQRCDAFPLSFLLKRSLRCVVLRGVGLRSVLCTDIHF